MNLRALLGSGDRIMSATLPVAFLGVVANVAYPSIFAMHLGRPGLVTGCVLLALGVPLWLTSATLIAVNVPRHRLVTRGPFALMLHPVYTAVSLLVLPGLGFVLDTWVCLAIGAAMYGFARVFARRESAALSQEFGEEYTSYRSRVLLPWL